MRTLIKGQLCPFQGISRPGNDWKSFEWPSRMWSSVASCCRVFPMNRHSPTSSMKPSKQPVVVSARCRLRFRGTSDHPGSLGRCKTGFFWLGSRAPSWDMLRPGSALLFGDLAQKVLKGREAVQEVFHSVIRAVYILGTKWSAVFCRCPSLREAISSLNGKVTPFKDQMLTCCFCVLVGHGQLMRGTL